MPWLPEAGGVGQGPTCQLSWKFPLIGRVSGGTVVNITNDHNRGMSSTNVSLPEMKYQRFPSLYPMKPSFSPYWLWSIQPTSFPILQLLAFFAILGYTSSPQIDFGEEPKRSQLPNHSHLFGFSILKILNLKNHKNKEVRNLQWIRKSYKILVDLISNLEYLISSPGHIQKPHSRMQENNQLPCTLTEKIFPFLNVDWASALASSNFSVFS